jgi:hypothetical protein
MPPLTLVQYINTHTMSADALSTICLATAVAGCLAINFIGLRFLLAPKAAADGFGVGLHDARAFTAIKGVRDITSGIVPLVVWRVAGQSAFGWAMTAAALTPIGDALVVISRGGSLGTALGMHGATAAVLIVTGQYLAK